MCAMNSIIALDLVFAVAVVTALAAICRLGYFVAGGSLDDTAVPAELPRGDDARLAA